MKPELRRLFEAELVVTRRAHPAAAHQLTHATRTGEAVALLPGTYCLSTVAGHASAKLLAPIRSAPDGVLTLGAAALAGYDFDRPCPATVVAATPQRTRQGRGIRLARRRIPAEWVQTRRGLRFTHPAWTALDLCGEEGPRAIDEALRLGVPLDAMEAALADRGRRRGNAALRAWLTESRDRPFSFAERAAHAALREGDVTGWRGNVRLRLPGRDVVLDIAFEREQLAVEVDGYTFHSSIKAFSHDRLRDADLMATGWVVLRLPATLVIDEPERFVHLVRRALAQRSGRP